MRDVGATVGTRLLGPTTDIPLATLVTRGGRMRFHRAVIALPDLSSKLKKLLSRFPMCPCLLLPLRIMETALYLMNALWLRVLPVSLGLGNLLPRILLSALLTILSKLNVPRTLLVWPLLPRTIATLLASLRNMSAQGPPASTVTFHARRHLQAGTMADRLRPRQFLGSVPITGPLFPIHIGQTTMIAG